MHYQEVERSELAQARAGLYQLLSRLYFEPYQPELLSLLEEWVSIQIEAEDSSPALSPEMSQSLSSLESFFKATAGKSKQELTEAVSIEFTRLFRGVKKGYSPPPPYESVYREESGRVFGELTMEVYHQYRHFGFDLADGLKNEPPDHLSFELEFMQRLCSQEAEAWQEDDERQALYLRETARDFCRKHLLAWLPQLRDRIREFDSIGFFGNLAELTVGWITLDYQQNLCDEAVTPPPYSKK